MGFQRRSNRELLTTLTLLNAIAAIGERLYARSERFAPLVTKMEIDTCTQNAFFSIERARRDLGYEPLVSTDEGIRLCVPYCLDLYRAGLVG